MGLMVAREAEGEVRKFLCEEVGSQAIGSQKKANMLKIGRIPEERVRRITPLAKVLKIACAVRDDP